MLALCYGLSTKLRGHYEWHITDCMNTPSRLSKVGKVKEDMAVRRLEAVHRMLVTKENPPV